MSPRWAPLAIALVACTPSLDWRDVKLDGATAQMPCKPEHLQRAVRVGMQMLKVRMHVCDAAGITWAVLETDALQASSSAQVRGDLARSLATNLGVAANAADAAASAASDGGSAGAWQVVRGRREDGALAIASASYAVRGAHVVQRVALLPREPGPADASGLEAFHAALEWAKP